MGLVDRQDADELQDGKIDFEIRNTNTGVVTKARMTRTADGSYALAQIPGVDGAFPGVDLFLQNLSVRRPAHRLTLSRATGCLAWMWPFPW